MSKTPKANSAPTLSTEQQQIVALNRYCGHRPFFDEQSTTDWAKRTFAKAMESCDTDRCTLAVHIWWMEHDATELTVRRNSLLDDGGSKVLATLRVEGELAAAMLADLRVAAAKKARREIQEERERELDRAAVVRVDALLDTVKSMTISSSD